MSTPLHVLLLAGAGEARDIATALAQDARLRTTASLHYPERAHGPLPVPTRIGGFGGDAGFRRFLIEEKVSVVVDATHSFASTVSRRTQRICRELGIPCAQVLRDEWVPTERDNWVDVANESEAARVIPSGNRIFATTGRATVNSFDNVSPGALFVRQLYAGEDKRCLPGVRFVPGTPPFSVAEETNTFRRLGISWLVTRNTGGDAGRSKLDAARELGLQVAMIRRPGQPEGPKLATVQAAVDWIGRQ